MGVLWGCFGSWCLWLLMVLCWVEVGVFELLFWEVFGCWECVWGFGVVLGSVECGVCFDFGGRVD